MRLLAVVVFCLLPFASFADAPRLARAMEAMRAGNWEAALSTAPAGVARDVIEWHALRSREGSLAEARAFLARNGD